MAGVELRAGAHVDFLTQDELAEEVAGLKQFMDALSRDEAGEYVTRSAGSFMTDSTGGTSTLPRGGGSVYDVPVGYIGFVVRLSVDYEGSNASSPQSCDLRMVADQNTPAALRSIANQVPNVFSASKSHAPLFRGGQHVVIALTGGPVSTSIYCTAQVCLIKRKYIEGDTLSS